MKTINYILPAMTHLRYFIPIIIEANKKNIQNNVFVCSCNGKYNSARKNLSLLHDMSKKYNFHITDNCSFSGVTFQIEGDDCNIKKSENETRVSLTYMTDFNISYKNYIDKVDYVVFPSKKFAEYFDTVSNKNIYLGSPKYDVCLNKKDILKKYNIKENKKRALIIFPRSRDESKIEIKKIYKALKEEGYEILVKTRGKDRINNKDYKGDYYFEDNSWFPHTTMELIKVSDIIVNFSSTVIKETIILEKPMINFHIKPFKRPLDFLYDFKFVIEHGNNVDVSKIKEDVNLLTTSNIINKDEYKKAKKKHLFTSKNVSKLILEKLLDV